MDQQKFQSHWTKIKPLIQKKWGKFTPEELKQIDGKKEVFCTKLQAKYGVGREEADRELDSLVKEMGQSAATGAESKRK